MKRNILLSAVVGGLTASILSVLDAPRREHRLRVQRAGQLREACRKHGDCDVDIYILSATEGFYCCNTHGLVSLYTDPAEIAALDQELRNLGKGAQ